MSGEVKYYVAFNLFPDMGPKRFKKLLAYFSNLEQAWKAPFGELRKAGIEKEIAEKLSQERPRIDPDAEIEKTVQEGIKVLTLRDKDYPRLLKEIYDPPPVLYLRGSFNPQDEFSLGVVGTRRLSSYGRQVTPSITEDLARAGLTIVSGLAHGIDTLAHKAALGVGARTIGVLGCGLENIYPPSNRRLGEEIAKTGALISEYPLGTPPLKHHFPFRNRIISGLSLGVLIIEAGEKSGALITAREALEQNREVFAVPGPIYAPNSLGPNNLIKMGAKLVTNATDILEELNLAQVSSYIETRKIIPDSREEAKILEFLSQEPIHIDKLVQKSKLDTSTVNSTLVMMEIKGKVRNLGAGNYVLAR